ncbi:retropepsin-like aspartic protease family protein [Oricola sp.]|uniref:retropepsin-like aspartic protease family protein n=1 Tax=Oricola sp. TaxID=1979950 RepID=UPI003BA98CC0
MNLFALAIFTVLGAGLLILLFNGNDGTIGPMSDDQFASTIYLGLLGTVLAAGLFASGQRFGTMARHAAIWLALLIVLVVSYEYRYELQNSAGRVASVLLPGQPVSSTDSQGRQTVTINRRGQHFVTRGTINGADQSFLVDTGASTIVLTESSARSAGYEVENLRFTVPVATANGTAMAARINDLDIEIGGIGRTNMLALVARDSALGSNLLGMNFLDTLSSFEVTRDRLVLRN